MGDALLGVRVFLHLKVNFGEQQSKFAIARFVFERRFQEVDALGRPVGYHQVIRLFDPKGELLSVRAAVGVDDALDAVRQSVHLLGFQEARIEPPAPFGFEILEVDTCGFQRVGQRFDHRVVDKIAGRHTFDSFHETAGSAG